MSVSVSPSRPAIVESQYQELLALDKLVDAAEGEGLAARWQFGDALRRRRVGKQLPKGVLADLVEKTGKSRAELKFRVQFAEMYPEVANALATFQSWHDFVNRKSDRLPRNAAGAHEGTSVSTGDAEGDGWKLLLGDFRERLGEISSGSVNAIVTDPPYPEEYLPLWSDLGREASRLLTDGGVLVARCGHLFLPEVLQRLSEHLAYGWTYSEPLPGANVRFMGRKIAVSFQPWVAFSNGSWPSSKTDWHPDTLEESPRAKERYVWEQKPSVAAELTTTFADPGNDVLDPFAGSGSYGVAALGVGCCWVGVEADPAGHAQAASRLSDVAP